MFLSLLIASRSAGLLLYFKPGMHLLPAAALQPVQRKYRCFPID
jgi:hypothetical protein